MFTVVGACLLAFAVSVDIFFAAMGCRMSGILIPKRSAALVSAFDTAVMGLALLFGGWLGRHVSVRLFELGGVLLIGGMGFAQIAGELLKGFMRRKQRIRRHALGLVIDICIDETAADTDGSKVLGIREVPAYAAALSLDALAAGIVAGFGLQEGLLCMGLMLVMGFLFTLWGNRAGHLSGKWRMVGGGLLIVMACLRYSGVL